MILAGDVGGTKTRLARFDLVDGKLREIRSQSIASAEVDGLADAIRRFESLPDPTLKAAAFGVAGPVRHGQVKTTNLPWVVNAADLSRCLGVGAVRVLNDLEAMAQGIEALGEEDLVTLQEGEPDPEGNAAVIAAGTGLGQALLVRRDGTLHASATEGGHSDFAPPDQEAMDLLGALGDRFDHVSAERVISGIGLEILYGFTHDTARGGSAPHLDPESEIPRLMAEAAQEDSCSSCRRAFSIFLRAYGAEAGNLALKAAATSGLFVGGGIAAANIDMMRDGTFIEAFARKGRFEGWMKRVPVKVILNESTPLLGAALSAARAAGLLGA